MLQHTPNEDLLYINKTENASREKHFNKSHQDLQKK